MKINKKGANVIKRFLLLLLKAALLFLPVISYMVYINYTVDPAGIYHGEQFARDAVNLLLQGVPISNYDQLESHTRTINEALIMGSPRFDTVVIGSSRSMLINAEVAGFSGTFLNMGVVGGSYQDMYGSFYLCAREGKVPSTAVLCVDPWMLNYNETDTRSIPEWYYSFIKYYLQFDIEYAAEPATGKFEALLDPAYFQGAIAYMKRDTSDEAKPEAVQGSIYSQSTTVKMPDGTVIYDEGFRRRTQEEIDHEVSLLAMSLPYTALRLLDYEGPSEQAKEEFEAFIAYMQACGVRVVLVLPPYHPIAYTEMAAQADVLPGLFATEEYLTAFAKTNGIELYGSYNPETPGLDNTMFYDTLHMNESGVVKLLEPLRSANNCA